MEMAASAKPQFHSGTSASLMQDLPLDLGAGGVLDAS
jgi:hypothetical protein